MKPPRIGIIGIGQSDFKARRSDANYPELVRDAVTLALNDCKLGLDDMQAVLPAVQRRLRHGCRGMKFTRHRTESIWNS